MVACCTSFTTKILSFFEKTASSISCFFGARKQITYHKTTPFQDDRKPLPCDIQKIILSYLPKEPLKKELKNYLKSPSKKQKENLLWLFKTLPQMDASSINFYPKILCLAPSHRIKKAHFFYSPYCNFPQNHKQLLSPLFELTSRITDLDLSFSHLTSDDFEKLVQNTSSLFSLKLYCSTYVNNQNILSLLQQNPQLSTLDIAGIPINFKEIKSSTIRKLNLAGNSCIDDKTLQIIAQNIPNITHLGLSSVPLLTDKSHCSLEAFTNLFSLCIGNNPQFTDAFFSTPLSCAKQIKELFIGNSRTTKYTKNALKIWLKDFSDLQELTIQETNLFFCDEDVVWIVSHFPKLKTLHLQHVKSCSDKGLLALKQLPDLQEVEITGNILISQDAKNNLHQANPTLICNIKNPFLSLENPIE